MDKIICQLRTVPYIRSKRRNSGQQSSHECSQKQSRKDFLAFCAFNFHAWHGRRMTPNVFSNFNDKGGSFIELVALRAFFWLFWFVDRQSLPLQMTQPLSVIPIPRLWPRQSFLTFAAIEFYIEDERRDLRERSQRGAKVGKKHLPSCKCFLEYPQKGFNVFHSVEEIFIEMCFFLATLCKTWMNIFEVGNWYVKAHSCLLHFLHGYHFLRCDWHPLSLQSTWVFPNGNLFAYSITELVLQQTSLQWSR